MTGYVPTKTVGRVTAGRGRVVQEIDHAPAAEVYNRRTNGAIRDPLKGGVGLHETVLLPLVGAATFGDEGCFTGLLPIGTET